MNVKRNVKLQIAKRWIFSQKNKTNDILRVKNLLVSRKQLVSSSIRSSMVYKSVNCNRITVKLLSEDLLNRISKFIIDVGAGLSCFLRYFCHFDHSPIPTAVKEKPMTKCWSLTQINETK